MIRVQGRSPWKLRGFQAFSSQQWPKIGAYWYHDTNLHFQISSDHPPTPCLVSDPKSTLKFLDTHHPAWCRYPSAEDPRSYWSPECAVWSATDNFQFDRQQCPQVNQTAIKFTLFIRFKFKTHLSLRGYFCNTFHEMLQETRNFLADTYMTLDFFRKIDLRQITYLLVMDFP